MDEVDIKLLERRVDELIRMVERLKEENRRLRDSHSTLNAERTRLVEKTELARSRVEAIIERLRTMEEES
jgi:cell division protein ZapB